MRTPGDGDRAKQAEGGDRDQYLTPRRVDADVAETMIGLWRDKGCLRRRGESPIFERDDHRFLVERSRIGDRDEDIPLRRQILSEKQRKSERRQPPTDPCHAANPLLLFPPVFRLCDREEHGQFLLPVGIN